MKATTTFMEPGFVKRLEEIIGGKKYKNDTSETEEIKSNKVSSNVQNAVDTTTGSEFTESFQNSDKLPFTPEDWCSFFLSVNDIKID